MVSWLSGKSTNTNVNLINWSTNLSTPHPINGLFSRLANSFSVYCCSPPLLPPPPGSAYLRDRSLPFLVCKRGLFGFLDWRVNGFGGGDAQAARCVMWRWGGASGLVYKRRMEKCRDGGASMEFDVGDAQTSGVISKWLCASHAF